MSPQFQKHNTETQGELSFLFPALFICCLNRHLFPVSKSFKARLPLPPPSPANPFFYLIEKYVRVNGLVLFGERLMKSLPK